MATEKQVNDRRLYEAMLQIRNAPVLAAFKEYLESLREDSRDRLENTLSAVDQGKAQLLKKLLDEIEKAPKVLESLDR